MDIFDVLSMVGGLALFLYGMHIMGDALAKMYKWLHTVLCIFAVTPHAGVRIEIISKD